MMKLDAGESAVLAELKFESMVLKSHAGPTFAFFSTPGCLPCKHMKPRIETKALELLRSVTYLNVFDCKDIAMNLGIRTAPTVVRFEAGKEVDRIVGLKSETEVERFLA